MSRTQYLQRLGQSWYIRVKVPAALRHRVGATHIRRALHTRDLDEANQRKWSTLALVRAYFNALHVGEPALLVLPAGDESAPRHHGRPPFPSSSATCGLRPTTGLDALSKEWSLTSPIKTVQFQRNQVYTELRRYLGGDTSPLSLTAAIAAAYVDECLLKSLDSPSTRRRKLSALKAFWEWMTSRCYVPRGQNPWAGFRLGKLDSQRTKPAKRPYTTCELERLFSGNPTYPALREVMALGLYTGARIDEICSLNRADIRIERDVAYIQIVRAKTNAGARTLAVSHPIPFGILSRRLRRHEGASDQLFHELRGGGYDSKLSWHVGQAFRYHRNGRGLNGVTDFHSLRRTFITRLENLGVDQVQIARYVGHSLPTLAFRVYSGGATEVTQAATGRAIHYAESVESAVAAFLKQSPQ